MAIFNSYVKLPEGNFIGFDPSQKKMPRSKIRLGLVHTFPDDSYGNGWNWQR